MTANEIERRISPEPTTVEYRDDGKTPVLRGYAAVFHSDSHNLGGFIETIHRNAFDRVLAAKPDVVGVYNHDKNYLLGRTGNGTMRLSVDDYGLRYEIDPPATRADVVEAVQRGDVVGSSFAFAISDGGDVWSRGTDGMRRREIRDIGLLDDCGPVVRPAYGSSSVVVSRRAIEMALGDNFRPNQTMANAAKRGLKLASKHEAVDQHLLVIAERLSARSILSLEEVSYLDEVYKRCDAARETGWNGSPAWIEWQLAGGDVGKNWIARRASAGSESPPAPAMAGQLKEGDFASWGEGYGRVEHIMTSGTLQGMEASAKNPVVVLTPFDDGEPEDSMVAKMMSELEAVDSDEERAAGDKSQSRPAPKEDQIKGSDKNDPGSAKNAAGNIKVSQSTRAALQGKVRDHNQSMSDEDKPDWSRVTLGQLLAVYRRGAGAYSTSHRPGVSRGAWAMARVNAYLYLLRNGRPKDSKYVTDNDILPKDHPKSSKERSVEVEIEERAEISLKPTAGMASACRRGLKLYEDGRGGDGLVPETISWAKKIAAGESLTKEKVVKMAAWHARHKVDKRPGWDKAGEESPGFVANLLWAGAAGARWSQAKVNQLRKAGEVRDMDDAVEDYESSLSARDLATAESYEAIAEDMGPWSQGESHYIADNPFGNIACKNCVFFEGEGRCYVVAGDIAPDAVCKLWIIPEDKMTEQSKAEETPKADPQKRDESADAIAKAAALKAILLKTHLHAAAPVK